LNVGLQLPRDLVRLRVTIEKHGFLLVVLDSLYNVADPREVDLRHDVGLLFARLKEDVCEPTGCTVLVVDHMPWATDQNRGRLRAYGDVFKAAAARFGIYIDAEGDKLTIEARGNNVRGFRRTPAYWDEKSLELRLVEAADRDFAGEIAQLLATAQGWRTSKEIAAKKDGDEPGIGANEKTVRGVLEDNPDRFVSRTKKEAQEVGRDWRATVWQLSGAEPEQMGLEENES
jgi:hypothetical protein